MNDPCVVGRELGVAVRAGRQTRLAAAMSLHHRRTGGRHHRLALWGDSCDCQLKDILEIQDVITRQLSAAENELRSLGLIRLADVERHAGRLDEALSCLNEAVVSGKPSGPWASARCNIELASTYKDLAISKEVPSLFEKAKLFYFTALGEFDAVGNHRLAASTENNPGYMLLCIGELSQAEDHFQRAEGQLDRA